MLILKGLALIGILLMTGKSEYGLKISLINSILFGVRSLFPNEINNHLPRFIWGSGLAAMLIFFISNEYLDIYKITI
jgi:hypothetical protein